MTAVAQETVAPSVAPDEHLAGELAWLELVLRRRVLQASARRGTDEQFDEFAGLFVPEGEIARYAAETDNAAPDGSAAVEQLDARIAAERRRLDERLDAVLRGGVEPRLQRIARRFGLTPVEVHLLVCCLAPDWSLRFQRYFAYLQNDVQRRRPTVQLLGELCTGDPAVGARRLLGAGAPLLRHGLLSIPQADLPFPARQPVVADAVAEFLAGAPRPDARLAGIASLRAMNPTWPTGQWFERHRDVFSTLNRALRREGSLPLVYLGGAAGSAKRLIVDALAAQAGARVLRADCRAWPGAGGWTRELLIALRRDAILNGAVLELAHMEALAGAGPEESRSAGWRAVLQAFLAESGLPVVMMTGTTDPDEMREVLALPLWTFEIPRPDLGERVDLWERELRVRSLEPAPILVDSLATAFRFTPREMRRALDSYMTGADAVSGADAAPGAVRAEHLLRACRESSRHAIQRLARRIPPRRTWDDLVLPDDARRQLDEICAGARGRRRVHDEWGFERGLALGAGLNVLFAGPSGVGKTMSAEVVAGALGLDLFAVDLSSVVSKYIGETEKNLAAVFDQAEVSSCVLFFDECDSLFGKRTDIRDSHDRWANLGLNFVLSRVDRYEGILILATNLRSNLDPALTRRIRYAVEFPFPETVQREQIWRRVFPPEAPVSPDVDFDFMARQFKLAGGSIRNIAVNAAFLAASNGGQVTMKHIVHATRRELQKMGKSCTRTEFGRYFSWVRDAAPAAEVES